jgi:hypothetical protein
VRRRIACGSNVVPGIGAYSDPKGEENIQGSNRELGESEDLEEENATLLIPPRATPL